MNEGTAIHAAIKRPEIGIETLLEGYTAQTPEQERKLEVTEEAVDYQALLKKFGKILDNRIGCGYRISLVTETLTPNQINTFLHATTALEKHPEYIEGTGELISKLIQNSYNAGYNDFTLNMENLQALNYIGYKIKGTEENPIIITITGKTGNCCGAYAEHCSFNAEETENTCGGYAKNCTFNTPETGDWFGYDVKNCTFYVENIGCDGGYGATGCTFTTANPKTLQQMLAEVPEGNRVVFIDAGGKEKVMRDYK